MDTHYSALIIENGKERHAECSGSTPGDALLRLLMAEHIRKGATIKLGCAYYDGDSFISNVYEYHHITERDLDFASVWERDGGDIILCINAKPE